MDNHKKNSFISIIITPVVSLIILYIINYAIHVINDVANSGNISDLFNLKFLLKSITDNFIMIIAFLFITLYISWFLYKIKSNEACVDIFENEINSRIDNISLETKKLDEKSELLDKKINLKCADLNRLNFDITHKIQDLKCQSNNAEMNLNSLMKNYSLPLFEYSRECEQAHNKKINYIVKLKRR